jgi:hypothetical protein
MLNMDERMNWTNEVEGEISMAIFEGMKAKKYEDDEEEERRRMRTR